MINALFLPSFKKNRRPPAKIASMNTLDSLKHLYEKTTQIPITRYSEPTSECLFIHRTGVIMADGELVTCANMYAENVGHLTPEKSFDSVWNNERLQSVRQSMGTESEWAQCQRCWFREIRYAEQRERWAESGSTAVQDSIEKPVEYRTKSWDFRKEQMK